MDIKLKLSWIRTIGTEYPGVNASIVFHGNIMTPESMGNFTYGYLGYVLGIPQPVLIAGSYYAAEFPIYGDRLENELWDWGYVNMGYLYAERHYLEGE